MESRHGRTPTADALGPVDILVNNAGIATTQLIEDSDEAGWRRVQLHTHSFPIEQAEDAIHALTGDIPGMNPVHLTIVPGAPRVPLPR